MKLNKEYNIDILGELPTGCVADLCICITTYVYVDVNDECAHAHTHTTAWQIAEEVNAKLYMCMSQVIVEVLVRSWATYMYPHSHPLGMHVQSS